MIIDSGMEGGMQEGMDPLEQVAISLAEAGCGVGRIAGEPCPVVRLDRRAPWGTVTPNGPTRCHPPGNRA